MQLEFGGRSYPVAAGDFVIGSGPDATLVLSPAGVLARHAVIRRLGDGMAVVAPAAPEAEILVNGARLGSDPTPLMHGDKIRIGGQDITVSDPRRAGATRVASSADMLGVSSAPPAPSAPSPPSPPSSRLVSLTDGREYALDVLPFTLGREATCGVVIEGDAVSRRHAEIQRVPDGDSLVDLSSNGTFVNGDRVGGKTILKRGDVIRIGEQELRYYPVERTGPPTGAEFRLGGTLLGIPAMKRPPSPPVPFLAPSEPPLASLLVKSGALSGTRFAVRAPVANIGRAEYNDVRLPDASVSASHAKLQLREGVWVVSDLGSTNGTKVDEEPVEGEAPLSPGASIAVGEVRLFFEPRDTGAKHTAGTSVLEVPLPAAPPPAPAVQGVVVGGARRQPAVPRPSPLRRVLLVAAVVVGALLLVGYLFLG